MNETQNTKSTALYTHRIAHGRRQHQLPARHWYVVQPPQAPAPCSVAVLSGLPAAAASQTTVCENTKQQNTLVVPLLLYAQMVVTLPTAQQKLPLFLPSCALVQLAAIAAATGPLCTLAQSQRCSWTRGAVAG